MTKAPTKKKISKIVPAVLVDVKQMVFYFLKFITKFHHFDFKPPLAK